MNYSVKNGELSKKRTFQHVLKIKTVGVSQKLTVNNFNMGKGGYFIM